MKRGRRFVAAVTLSSCLAVCFSFGGAVTTAYAACSNAATATGLTSFCAELQQYIDRLEALKPGPLRDFLLRVASAIQAKYCALVNGPERQRDTRNNAVERRPDPERGIV